MKKWIPISGVLIACMVIISMSGFIFENSYLPDRLNRNVMYYEATVIDVLTEQIESDSYTGEFEVGVQELTVEITEGPFKGEQHQFKNYISRLYNVKAKSGTDVIVGVYLNEGEITDLTINTYKRSHVIFVLALIFFMLVAWIGKFKGIKSVVSLLFTGTCVIFLMLPLLLRGTDPILAASLVVFLSTFVTFGLVSGINRKTGAAVLGTLSGVLVAALIAYVFGSWAHLSGATMQETETLLYVSETSGLQIRGLMFAAILIASLGAVMDVAMSISSAMYEFVKVNPDISSKQLFTSGMNVGTDMIGTMTNTLILALAGGSLNSIILIYAASLNNRQLMNMDVLGVELIQGLAGSIGIVITVPLSVIFSIILYKNVKFNTK
ncbi:MAG: YibE/F family protein [Turicibacter sp.]